MGCARAVGGAFVHLEYCIFDDLGREQRRSADRHDLVVIAMQNQVEAA
jgi:hypothetical protein